MARKKPVLRGPFSPMLVDPAWHWAWRGVRCAYLMWEGGGGTIHDVTGRFHGVQGGGGASADPTWAITEDGLVTRYNGSTQKYTLGYIGPFSNQITVAAYLRSDVSDADNRAISVWGDENPQEAWMLWMDTGGVAGWAWIIGDSAAGATRAGEAVASVDITRLQPVVGTWDGTTARIYVDGVQKDSQTSARTMTVTTEPVAIGGMEFNNIVFDGDIACVIISEAVWTPQQVRQWSSNPYGPFQQQRRSIATAVVVGGVQVLRRRREGC